MDKFCIGERKEMKIKKFNKRLSAVLAVILAVNMSRNAFAYGTTSFSATCVRGASTILAQRVKTDTSSYASASLNRFELVNPPSVYQILFSLQLVVTVTGKVIGSNEISRTGTVSWKIIDPENAVGLRFDLKGRNNSSTAVSINVAGIFGI